MLCLIVSLALVFFVAQNWFLFVTLSVITGFFLFTLARSFVDVRFLDRETRLASEQVRQLVEVNDVARFLEVSRSSLFRSHIASLYQIFRSHTEIQQDSLIEVTHAQLMARNKVVELFSSTLITLGLIGTIVGMIAVVRELSGTLETVITEPSVVVSPTTDSAAADDGDDEGKRVLRGMFKTIRGMKTAFYTTLLGSLFGGVMLRLLTNVVDSAILRYMAHLAELTEVHVLPPLRRMAGSLDKKGYYRRLDA